MKKRLLIYLIVVLLILLIPSVLGESDILFEDVVKNGESYTVDEHDLYVTIDQDSLKTLINFDTITLILGEEDCEERLDFTFCTRGVEYDENYSTEYEINLEISQIISKLTSSTEIGKEDIQINEKTRVVYNILNEEAVRATDVYGVIKMPDEVVASNADGCVIKGRDVVIESAILSDKTIRCVFDVKGIKSGSYILEANYSFYNGIETISEIGNPVNGKVLNKSYIINYYSNVDKFYVGDEFDFTLYIKNDYEDQALTISKFLLRVPSALKRTNIVKNIGGSGDLLSWSGSLNPGENESFEFKFVPESTGIKKFVVDSFYRVDTISEDITQEFDIQVECDCPIFNINIYPEIKAKGDEVELIVDLLNPNTGDTYSVVDVKYTTDIPGVNGGSVNYMEFKPGQLLPVFRGKIKSPEDDGFYKFDVIATILSANGETYEVVKGIIIQNPKDESVDVVETVVETVVEPVVEQTVEEDVETNVVEGDVEEDVIVEEDVVEEEEEDVDVVQLKQGKSNVVMFITIGFIVASLIIIIFLFFLVKKHYFKKGGKHVFIEKEDDGIDKIKVEGENEKKEEIEEEKKEEEKERKKKEDKDDFYPSDKMRKGHSVKSDEKGRKEVIDSLKNLLNK